MAFSGFSTEHLVGLPPELFSEVLPSISLPSELKVTLHMFYRLSRQRGNPRRLSWDELLGDALLRRGLQALAPLRPVEEMLSEGVESAVRRKTFLHVPIANEGRVVSWYLANTVLNRRWASALGAAERALQPNPSAELERRSLIALYEENIGLVTPMIVEELREAETRYPPTWVEEAMREAVRANARSWRYVQKVLERWASNGKKDETDRAERPIDIERYTSGEYEGLFRRGGDDT